MIGTGCIVNIDDKSYTAIKKGDVNGDGVVDARDSLRILKFQVGSYEIKGVFLQSSDIDYDGEVTAKDALRCLKYTVGTYDITLK